MPTVHTVQPGEHLAAIAEAHGFSSIDPIWNDPANKQLKELRENPNVLKAGDKITIPDKEARVESGATDAKHKFVLSAQLLKLRVKLQDVAIKALDGAECLLDIGTLKKTLTTDGDGQIEQNIPASSREGRLIVTDKIKNRTPLDIGVGELDPVDTETGQMGRLYNLAYHPGPVGPAADDVAKRRFKSAVEEFQCENGLSVDGVCGKDTQGKLKSVHGS